MRWVGHLVRIGEKESQHAIFWWRNLSEGGHLESLGIDGKII